MSGTVSLLLIFLFVSSLHAAPKAELWPVWQHHADVPTITLDHSPWKRFLDKRLSLGKDSASRVDYDNVTPDETAALEQYLTQLQKIEVSRLTLAQQKSYWINLYNAGTVKVILDHYPVDSILDIDISPGWFSNGPWGKKLFTIEGTAVSLDDIEHRILRPIWRDPRVHYALNCASIGCPDLQPVPFTPKNMEELLDQATRGFIAHPRGVNLDDGKLTLSSIYIWFKEDFGGSDQGIIRHLTQYSEQQRMHELRKVQMISDHQYDWSLNKLNP